MSFMGSSCQSAKKIVGSGIRPTYLIQNILYYNIF